MIDAAAGELSAVLPGGDNASRCCLRDWLALVPDPARRWAGGIRWSSSWRDKTFSEDLQRARTGSQPNAGAAIRNLVIGAFRRAGFANIATPAAATAATISASSPAADTPKTAPGAPGHTTQTRRGRVRPGVYRLPRVSV